MPFLVCGRILCALMLPVHPAHYVTHQGLPRPTSQVVAIDWRVPRAAAGSSPGRFDSEEPLREVVNKVPNLGSSAGNDVIAQAGVAKVGVDAYGVLGEIVPLDLPGTFDSEERPREIEHDQRDAGTAERSRVTSAVDLRWKVESTGNRS